MERRLPTAQGFYEFGLAAMLEVLALLRGYGADFAAAARVDGIELRCYNMGWWRGLGSARGFGGEEARYEGFLEGLRGAVGDGAGEVEVN